MDLVGQRTTFLQLGKAAQKAATFHDAAQAANDVESRKMLLKRMKETAIKKLAESNKEMWHIENARYFLLQLADQIEKNELLNFDQLHKYGKNDEQIHNCIAQYTSNLVKSILSLSP
mgnify:CR=1 FL=1